MPLIQLINHAHARMSQTLPVKHGIGTVTAPEMTPKLPRTSPSATLHFVLTTLDPSNAASLLLNKQPKLTQLLIPQQH